MTLLDEGMSQADVARELSVTRQTVSRWARLQEAYPDDQPWRRRALGRPQGLTDEQKTALVRLLADRYVIESGVRGPGPTRRTVAKPARWTLARVGGLLEAEFGISYSLAHVKTILAGLVGDDDWLLSRPRFWARIIEVAYPEYEGQAFVENFDDGWEVNIKVIWELRGRLRL
ncbi:helix-turn-helix domain-containing protein [Burkholderia sp. R-69980]|nr:helix-turn-helix domain-containing protein [Burkholderia sp. R-69980]